jgi:hypothetical protein
VVKIMKLCFMTTPTTTPLTDARTQRTLASMNNELSNCEQNQMTELSAT